MTVPNDIKDLTEDQEIFLHYIKQVNDASETKNVSEQDDDFVKDS